MVSKGPSLAESESESDRDRASAGELGLETETI